MTTPAATIVCNNGSSIVLQFEQEDTSKFDAAWLWSNCPSYYLPTSAQKQRSPGDYRGSQIVEASIITVREAMDSGSGPIVTPALDSCHPIGTVFSSPYKEEGEDDHEGFVLRVVWNDDPSPSFFDLNWLKRWRYDEKSLQKRRERTEVNVSHAIRASLKNDEGKVHGLVQVDFASLEDPETADNTVFCLLQAVFTQGAAFVTNAPPVPDGPNCPVAITAKHLSGYLSHASLYGDTFHVQSSINAHNIAYTSLPLPPHQDLAYYESIPGLQLLHCVQFTDDIIGGESTLIDCMAAAAHFRNIAPHHFRTLATFPATFVKQRDGACMTYLRPHIVLNPSSCNSNADDIDREILSVNWSPPFEGPLCIPSEHISSYFEAYSAFQRMLDDSIPLVPGTDDHLLPYAQYAKQYTWEYHLKPGQMLIFNNHRMLHGRRQFSFRETTKADAQLDNNDQLNRHLVGCYTNIDDTLNRYRVLLRERAEKTEDCFVINAGNGTSMIP